MNEPRKDDERVSALLEGRVTGSERDALLAHLSTSPDDYEVFADTAEILEALEEEDARAGGGAAAAGAAPVRADAVPDGTEGAAPADVLPLRRPARGGLRSPWARLAMAAAIAGVLLASGLVWRARSSAGAYPVRIAARVDSLPQRWLEQAPGSMRGDTPAGRNAQAAQVGALLVDLAVAVHARDADKTRLLSQMLRSYGLSVGEGTPLGQIHSRAGASPGSLQPLLARVTDQLSEAYNEDHLRLGAWTEAARLAANARDEEFFHTRASGRMLRSAERLTAGDAPAQAAVRRVRQLVDAEPLEWSALRPALDDLMRGLAS